MTANHLLRQKVGDKSIDIAGVQRRWRSRRWRERHIAIRVADESKQIW